MRRKQLLPIIWSNKVLNLCVGIGALTLAGIFVTGPVCAAQSPWKLVWSDEFNGPAGAAPDPASWTFEEGLGSQVGGNEEAETYCAFESSQPPCKANEPNAYLDGHGHLVIVAIRTNDQFAIRGKGVGSPVYTSARLTARKDFRYGRIEASLRVPVGQGVWPAFWALGSNDQNLKWPAVGEIDIMESWNPQPGTTKIDPFLNHASVHGPLEPGSKQDYINLTDKFSFPQPMQQAFHQFTAEWSPGEVDFYCDGNLYSKQSVADLTGKEVWELDNSPFHLLLNLAMGGNFFGYPDATTSSTPTLVADYVRIYQRDDSLLPSGWGNADIGGPREAGSSENVNGVWTIAGSGLGIAGRSDQFQFAYKALAGDGEVSARVLSQTSKVAEAKAGVMIRDGRGSGAIYAMLFVSPDGSLHFRARGNENDVPGETLIKGTANWMKVGRNGEIFTGYISKDGNTWKAVGQAKLEMHRDVLAGLISTSRDNGTPNAVQFDYVNVTRSDAAWDGIASPVPGTIQAEDFDTGGAGYSYKATMKHKGALPFREGDGPAIKMISLQGEPNVVPGGYYLTDLRKDDYLNYSVIISKEGDYTIHARVASNGVGGYIHFNFDQKVITKSMAIPDTGGPQNWREIDSGAIHLPEGQHTVALVVDSTGSNGSAGDVDFFTIRSR